MSDQVSDELRIATPTSLRTFLYGKCLRCQHCVVGGQTHSRRDDQRGPEEVWQKSGRTGSPNDPARTAMTGNTVLVMSIASG